MATVSIEKLTYKQLLDLESKVGAAIVKKKQEEKAALKRKMAEMAASSGFDLSELVGAAKGGARKGSTVAPKYRHPSDATLTWSGRGRQPRWLVAELKKGKKLQNFVIEA
ncbi:MAG: H-NS histone family protein [Hyphomicrobiaceae bacterium]|nr:H-NS histone family protein [Hyphomicrobiaceae bacterium]